MKILLHAINFAPEQVGAGRYTGELAAWLQARGHQVHVVTAPPYYPNWQVGKGYSALRYAREQWMGMDVHRVPLWVPRSPTGTRRMLHLISFALAALPALARQVFWRPDLVFVVEPALACAPGALLMARLGGAKAWLHVQDYEVDVAFNMGLLRGALTRGIAFGLERWLMRRFDVVSSISNAMMRRAADKGVASERLVSLPNWVDIGAVTPDSAAQGSYRQELGIPKDAVIAMYSGSMGPKHGVEMLALAASRLQHVPKLVFVFCGAGAGMQVLQKACGGLSNVRTLPLQPLERLGELLATADIHLLPQKPDAADLVMPSKLTGMLSSGRPVVATADRGTELERVVIECGRVVPPDDVAAFAAAVQELAGDPACRAALGGKARRLAEQTLAKDAVLGRLERDFINLCVSSRPRHAWHDPVTTASMAANPEPRKSE